MEWVAFPLGVAAIALFYWVILKGPEKMMREHRLSREANAKAEEARTERVRLELEQAQVERDRDRA